MTSIGNSAFFGCDRLTYNEYGNCKYLGNNDNPYLALISATNQDSRYYIIHENTKIIMSLAFESCIRLTEIVIPDSVTSIDKYAFYSCDSLTKIVIPDGVTSIGDYAFFWCDNLTIYCETESQPEGWGSSWNYSYRPVVWGYKGE